MIAPAPDAPVAELLARHREVRDLIRAVYGPGYAAAVAPYRQLLQQAMAQSGSDAIRAAAAVCGVLAQCDHGGQFLVQAACADLLDHPVTP